MRVNEQLRRELEDTRNHLSEIEQREAYGREKLSAEITRLQLQINKLNIQGYNKDGIMTEFQAINPVMRQVNSSMAFKREPKVYKDYEKEEEPEVGNLPIHSKEEECQRVKRKYNRSINEDSHNSINKRKVNDVEERFGHRECNQIREEKKEDKKNQKEDEPVKHKSEDREKIIKNIENKLLSLQIEKKTVNK